MSLAKYSNQGPIDPSIAAELTSLKDKSVVITGGASGLGLAYAKAFTKAGALVTIGNVNEEACQAASKDLGDIAFATVCDVTNWVHQLSLFQKAIETWSRPIYVVVANAGKGGLGDSMVTIPASKDPSEAPPRPELDILDVNLRGVLYTTHLALHYLAQRGEAPTRDCALILISSMSAYVDWESSIQYPVSKTGIRTLMKCLRRNTWKTGIRVNTVAPSYIETVMIPPQIKPKIIAAGVEFAELDDAVQAVLRVATDTSINGRSLGVFNRQRARYGYMDLDSDDYKEDDLIYPIEQLALSIKFG